VKNAEEANSPTYRQRIWDWWRSTATTRLEPGAAVVVIMTRWHGDDLAGRILAEEGERWRVISLPALAEADDPLGRAEGEALWPERYPAEELARIRTTLGSYWWSALYMQRPTAQEGGMFKRPWFAVVDAAPAVARRCRYWDKAGTADGGAYTAGVLVAITEDGLCYVVDVVRGQWSALERERAIVQTAQLDAARYGNSAIIVIEQEPGSGGLESAQATIRRLVGYPVYADRPTGAKELRAQPLAAQAEAGNVHLVAGSWNAAYLDEIAAFPFGRYKDQVDATSGAFNALAVPTVDRQERIHYYDPVSISRF